MLKIHLTTNAADSPVSLTPDGLFGSNSITLLMLYTVLMTGHRAETRTRAMQALMMAVLPAVLMAVEVVLVPHELSGALLESVVAAIMTDLQHTIPTWSVCSGRQLMRRIAERILTVLATGPSLPPVDEREVLRPAGDLIRLLHPAVRTATLMGLFPRLEANALEVLLRMTQPDATWARVAATLRTTPDALRRQYTSARANAEELILDEITRRQMPRRTLVIGSTSA